MGLRPPLFTSKRHSRGTLWYDLLQRCIAVSAAVARSPLIEVHDLSPLSVVVLSIIHNSLKATTDCPGDLGPVRTCHARWIKSSIHFKSNSPPRGCEFTRVLPVPGTCVTSVGHSYQYPELLYVLYARVTIPGTSRSSGRLSYPYPNLS